MHTAPGSCVAGVVDGTNQFVLRVANSSTQPHRRPCGRFPSEALLARRPRIVLEQQPGSCPIGVVIRTRRRDRRVGMSAHGLDVTSPVTGRRRYNTPSPILEPSHRRERPVVTAPLSGGQSPAGPRRRIDASAVCPPPLSCLSVSSDPTRRAAGLPSRLCSPRCRPGRHRSGSVVTALVFRVSRRLVVVVEREERDVLVDATVASSVSPGARRRSRVVPPGPGTRRGRTRSCRPRQSAQSPSTRTRVVPERRRRPAPSPTNSSRCGAVARVASDWGRTTAGSAGQWAMAIRTGPATLGRPDDDCVELGARAPGARRGHTGEIGSLSTRRRHHVEGMVTATCAPGRVGSGIPRVYPPRVPTCVSPRALAESPSQPTSGATARARTRDAFDGLVPARSACPACEDPPIRASCDVMEMADPEVVEPAPGS